MAVWVLIFSSLRCGLWWWWQCGLCLQHVASLRMREKSHDLFMYVNIMWELLLVCSNVVLVLCTCEIYGWCLRTLVSITNIWTWDVIFQQIMEVLGFNRNRWQSFSICFRYHQGSFSLCSWHEETTLVDAWESTLKGLAPTETECIFGCNLSSLDFGHPTICKLFPVSPYITTSTHHIL